MTDDRPTITTEEVFRRLRALKPKFAEMNIKRMAVFGSYARGEAGPDSDVDILIDHDDHMTFFKMSRLKRRLEAVLDMPIDLVPRDGLHPGLKDRILSEAQDV